MTEPARTTRASGPARSSGSGSGLPPVRVAQEAWRELLRTSTVLLRDFEAAGDFGELSVREYDVLRALAESGGSAGRADACGGLRLGALAEATYLPQPSMSRLVERLEGRGLVARESSPGDGRGTLVCLTEAGRATQRAVGRRHVRSIQAALAPLSVDELALLTDLVARLRAHAEPAGAGNHQTFERDAS